HDEAGAAAVALRQLDRAPVRLRDRAHDGEAEAAAASGVALAADEAFEQPVTQLGGNAGPVVLDLQKRAVLRPQLHAYARPGRGVNERVLDQVEREPVQVVGRAVDHHG